MATGEFRLSFTAQEIDNRLKKLDNIQSDYEQNNSNADNYIKNRPFYTGDPIETELVDINAVSAEYGEDWWHDGEETVDGTNYVWQAEFPTIGLQDGKTYVISIDGNKYSGVVQNLKDTMGAPFDYFALGDIEAMMNGNPEALTYAIAEIPFEGFTMMAYKGPKAPTECKIFSLKQEVKKLDRKYLPIPEGGYGYEEESAAGEILVEEQIVSIDEELYSQISESLTFEVGETYIATFNGKEYRLTAWDVWDNGPIILIGDGDIYGGEGMGEDAPFSCDSYPDGECYLNTTEPGEYTIEIRKAIGIIIHQIDEKFIPCEIPDWNANDPESKNYIKNRPFYEEPVTGDIVLDTAVTVSTNYSGGYYGEIFDSVEIDTNKKYVVVLDNVTYTCTPWYNDNWECIVLGNGKYVEYAQMGENVPFAFEVYSDGNAYLNVSERGECVIQIFECIGMSVHKLDEKFLPILQEELMEHRTTILKETTLDLTETKGDKLAKRLNLIEGATYVVTLNNIEYICIAWYRAGNDYNDIALGNESIDSVEGMGEDVPFYINDPLDRNDRASYLYVAENGIYTIKIENSVLTRKIDPKYLPDNISEGNTNNNTGNFIDVVQEDGSIITKWIGA